MRLLPAQVKLLAGEEKIESVTYMLAVFFSTAHDRNTIVLNIQEELAKFDMYAFYELAGAWPYSWGRLCR